MSSLLVRLPNHLGDVCMALPALDLLAARGYALTVVGKPWAASLLEAYRWPVVALSGGLRAQISTLRTARVRSGDARGLLLTNSLGSALAFRLAGVRATGYANEGRRWLLADAVPLPDGARNARAVKLHMVEYYYQLAARLGPDSAVRDAAPSRAPDELKLRLSERARAAARSLCAAAGAADYAMVCPVAVGLHHGRVKAWDGFARLSAELVARGIRVLACPGPGEHAAVVKAAPAATVLPATDVGTFAALLAGSRLVIANDSGPGHLAAAVGVPLLSIFGVTELGRTRPWGKRARIVGRGLSADGASGWPTYAEVADAVDEMLAPAPAA